MSDGVLDNFFDDIRDSFGGKANEDNTSIVGFSIGGALFFGSASLSVGVARYQNELTGATDYAVYFDKAFAAGSDLNLVNFSFDMGNFNGNASDLAGATIGVEAGLLFAGTKIETPVADVYGLNWQFPDFGRGGYYKLIRPDNGRSCGRCYSRQCLGRRLCHC
jgi:hypothetical protein